MCYIKRCIRLCVLGVGALTAACAQQQAAPIVSHAVATRTIEAETAPAFYKVMPGETLATIAKRFRIGMSQLVEWNQLERPDLIYPGQILRLRPPAIGMAAVTASPPPSAATPHGLEARPQSPPDMAQTRGLAPPAAILEKPLSVTPRPPVEVKPVEPESKAFPPPLVSVPPLSPPPASTPVSPQDKDHEGIHWVWPSNGPVLSRFDPGEGMRHGIDIGGNLNDPVRAAAAGRVAYSGGGLRGYGKLIIIKHDKNYITAYAHNAQLLVKEGARVKAGQVIARMGQTGNAGRVLLHFELRRHGKPIDPLEKLPPR